MHVFFPLFHALLFPFTVSPFLPAASFASALHFPLEIWLFTASLCLPFRRVKGKKGCHVWEKRREGTKETRTKEESLCGREGERRRTVIMRCLWEKGNKSLWGRWGRDLIRGRVSRGGRAGGVCAGWGRPGSCCSPGEVADVPLSPRWS